MEIRRRNLLICSAALVAGVFAAYSNHFENVFHFDDYNTIVDNPAIRTLDNIPRFFSDATLFSTIVTNRSYRPLLETSIAIDYMLGGGLNPFWFHVSTFLWFLAQLALMYALYMYVLNLTRPGPENWWLAWFAVAIYGLHPVSAETVNYIIQRGDLYAALGIVAGVVVYAWKPNLRGRGLYLLPPLAAMLAKPTSLIFAPLLLIYIVLIDPIDLLRAALEKKQAARDRRTAAPVGEGSRKKSRNGVPSPVPAETQVAPDGRSAPGSWRSKQFLESCIRKSIPAFLLCAAFSYFEKAMTPPTFSSTTLSSLDYWITQPYVTLRYFCSFFLPVHLNVDTDMRAFQSMWNVPALAGIGFCILLVVAAIQDRAVARVACGVVWTVVVPDRPGSHGPLSAERSGKRSPDVSAVCRSEPCSSVRRRQRCAPLLGRAAAPGGRLGGLGCSAGARLGNASSQRSVAHG